MSFPNPFTAFLAPIQPPNPLRRPRPARCPMRMSSSSSSNTLPTQERVLRLERALAAAVLQERYNDAASLRDALQAARHSDPMLSKRAELDIAVASEDFTAAARLRDEIATLTEQFSRANAGRRVDRIIVLRGRAHPAAALRVATVSRDGSLQLSLDASSMSSSAPPTVYLQPTWSPSGDFVAITEISFNIDINRSARTVAIADSMSRLVIMSAFDGSVVKSAPLRKPPFFYYWSPDGRCVTLLSNDPDASATTVALSAMQVVAPPGGGGALDLEHVTGPLASGHPFLYDFCPRDSTRVVAHMGDKSSVAIVPVSRMDRFHRFLTTNAGSFGAPQWHPKAGKDGREVVLFVEREKKGGERKKGNESGLDSLEGLSNGSLTVVVEDNLDENEDGKKKPGEFERFLSNGSSLLESVLRKGAESLGLTSSTNPNTNEDDDKTNSQQANGEENNNNQPNAKNKDDSDQGTNNLPLRRLLQKRPGMKDQKWGDLFVSDNTVNRLVMCDADNPELRRTIARFTGVMAFKLSPDGNTLATLVTNPTTGEDELTVCTGDFSPDSVDEKRDVYGFTSPKSMPSNTADIILSTPYTRVLAFFWSPNSQKLLFLTSLRGSRVGAAQWATFDLLSNKVIRYEKFVISGIYMHCLNFFDQFASSMTPWSPDSDAFCYPGRPLTQQELEKEQDQSAEGSPALSVLFLQRDGASDGKRFCARVQKVPNSVDGDGKPEEAETIVDNVEYTCWSPC